MQILATARRNRITFGTQMNQHSSRSHALLCITVQGTDLATGSKTTGSFPSFFLSFFFLRSYHPGLWEDWFPLLALQGSWTWWTWRAQRGSGSPVQRERGWRRPRTSTAPCWRWATSFRLCGHARPTSPSGTLASRTCCRIPWAKAARPSWWCRWGFPPSQVLQNKNKAPPFLLSLMFAPICSTEGVCSGQQRGRDAVLSEVCSEGLQGGAGSCSQEDRIWWTVWLKIIKKTDTFTAKITRSLAILAKG